MARLPSRMSRAARPALVSVPRTAAWPRRVSAAILLVRVLVGWVFLAEGIQKFLYPAALGVGRFAKIGIPRPEILAPFVGVVEIVCGVLVIAGLLTRLASIPLLIDICTAIVTTKIAELPKIGFWATAHDARTDFSMLFGLIFLLIAGGGRLAADAAFRSRRESWS